MQEKRRTVLRLKSEVLRLVCWGSSKVQSVDRGSAEKCGEEKRNVGLVSFKVTSPGRNEKILVKAEEISDGEGWGGETGKKNNGVNVGVRSLIYGMEEFGLSVWWKISSDSREGCVQVKMEEILREGVKCTSEVRGEYVKFTKVSSTSDGLEKSLSGVIVVVAPGKIGKDAITSD